MTKGFRLKAKKDETNSLRGGNSQALSNASNPPEEWSHRTDSLSSPNLEYLAKVEESPLHHQKNTKSLREEFQDH